jgi:cell wall-associated NlpC family hydrolase
MTGERRASARYPIGMKRARASLAAVLFALLLSACGSVPTTPSRNYVAVAQSDKAHDIVVYALGLIDANYRYGGRNPEAGLDCSGMVSHIYEQVTGVRLPHNAARIAQLTRPIARAELRPGDLVFFNTLNRSHSHVGIYVGEGRFVHAPSASSGKVQIARLDDSYFSSRYEGARTLFPH